MNISDKAVVPPHAKTDPACLHYKETGPFRRYLNDHGRGKACLACVPPRNAK